jgi:hypothetical protein
VPARLIVHIGQQKSGTTYLQGILARSGPQLAPVGISYPLPWAERGAEYENQQLATYGFLAAGAGPAMSDKVRQARRREWAELVEAVNAADGTVLLSAEVLAGLSRPSVERFVAEFACPRIEIVITSRRLDQILASLWQQHVRNGRVRGLDGFLGRIAEERRLPADRLEDDPEPRIWRELGLAGLVRRWAGVVGLDAVRLVTNPGAPPELLWSRFSEAIGATGLEPAPEAAVAQPSNTSLTAAEATVLAAINAELAQSKLDSDARAGLRQRIIRDGFLARLDRGRPIRLGPPYDGLVAGWSGQDLTELAELTGTGLEVIGSLADLRVAPGSGTVAPLSSNEIIAAASSATAAAIGYREPLGSRLRRSLRRATSRGRRPAAGLTPPAEPGVEPGPDRAGH